MTRTHKLLSLLPAAALALTLGSCSLLGDKGTVVRAESAETGQASAHTPTAKHAEEASRKHHDAAAPAKSSRLSTDTRLDGEWLIVEVGGKAVHRDCDMPYIHFAGREGRFYASNGCNVLNGDFALHSSKLSFSHVLSTMMLCHDVQLEQAVNAVVRDDREFSVAIAQTGDETYMTLADSSGRTVMRLRRDNLERLNGQWAVTSIAGTEIADPEVKLFFDIPEKSVHGNTGCNYFNGAIEADPDQSNSIAFSSMSVTMRACPGADVERSMLVALEETASYRLDGENLTLLSRSGQELMTLHRTIKVD